MNKYETWDRLKEPLPEVDKDGTQRWFNSKRQAHREYGPAILYANGTKYFVQNGNIHREDGPAIMYLNGSMQWYLNGHHLSEEEFNEQIRNMA